MIQNSLFSISIFGFLEVLKWNFIENLSAFGIEYSKIPEFLEQSISFWDRIFWDFGWGKWWFLGLLRRPLKQAAPVYKRHICYSKFKQFSWSVFLDEAKSADSVIFSILCLLLYCKRLKSFSIGVPIVFDDGELLVHAIRNLKMMIIISLSFLVI